MSRLIEAAGNLLVTALQSAEEVVRSATANKPQGKRSQHPDLPVDAQEVDLLTFRDVVTWLTQNRPDDKHVVKAAVLREKRKTDLKVSTVFLDRADEVVRGENNIPFGRAQRVKRLDQELEEFFGDRDMVLFE